MNDSIVVYSLLSESYSYVSVTIEAQNCSSNQFDSPKALNSTKLVLTVAEEK